MAKSPEKSDKEAAPVKGKGTATDAAAKLAKDKAAAKKHTQYVLEKQSERTKANAECGPIPPPEDPERRERYRFDLQGFAETYLPKMFVNKQGEHRPWADFHIESFKLAQQTILDGGQLAEALPRGSAKTTIIAAAIIWAAVYGHCKFAVAVCATDGKAVDLLELVKIQFEVAPLLLADFPEVCIPVRHLERKTQKCKTQTVDGINTRIEWTEGVIVLPTVAGSQASGFRFHSAGLTGSGIRGLLAPNADGQPLRPDIILIDDPQTDDSARSLLQCGGRLRLIDTVMGMVGPGESLAVFACVTVIRAGDVADTLLNNPDWTAIRYGILDKMPTKEQMVWWAQYRDIQLDSKNRRLGREPEIQFYRQNQAVMDGETKATWPARFNAKAEISGIQAAMNLFYKFPLTFDGEYMNEPKSLDESQIYRLDKQSVRERLTGLPRGVVPLGYDFITVGVDIQLRVLFYAVMAWKMDLTGSIIDYGYVPKQRRREFDLDNLEFTLQSQSGAIDANVDAAVSWGLMQFGAYLDQQTWLREDKLQIFPKTGQIDINFRASESAVGRFCRTSKWKSLFTPAMGQAMTKTKKRISEWKDHPGQNWPPARQHRRECQWMETNPRDHGCRERYFDTNHWKTFVNTALSLPLHSPGSISIFGESPEEHRQLSEHLTSHYPQEVTIDGIDQTQWVQRPNTRDDLLDCVIGCAVSASRHGARLSHVTSALPAINEPSDRRIINIPAHRIVRGASL